MWNHGELLTLSCHYVTIKPSSLAQLGKLQIILYVNVCKIKSVRVCDRAQTFTATSRFGDMRYVKGSQRAQMNKFCLVYSYMNCMVCKIHVL